MTDLLAHSSTALRAMIGARTISAVELLEAVIARIDALNPCVNAIAARDDARARQAAEMADRAVRAGEPLGLLHGLPTGIKDLHEVEGLLTTFGSPLYRNHVPKADCAMVANVRRQGAVILCKTNVPEFGAGANTRNPVWGATGNPFDPRLIAGASYSTTAAFLNKVPSLGGEFGGGGGFDAEGYRIAEIGARRVMHHLGILKGEPPAPLAEKIRKATVKGRDYFVFAPENSVFEPIAQLGDTVRKGDLAGRVWFSDNPRRPPEAAYFQTGGFVVCRRAMSRCERGDCLYHLCTDLT